MDLCHMQNSTVKNWCDNCLSNAESLYFMRFCEFILMNTRASSEIPCLGTHSRLTARRLNWTEIFSLSQQTHYAELYREKDCGCGYLFGVPCRFVALHPI